MSSILLVDDDQSFLEILACALKNKGINSVLASGVDEAIDLINKIKFDLICSDYEMGEKNGLDLLKHLRKEYNTTKFIMLTGHDDSKLQYEVECNNGIFLEKLQPELVNKIINELN